MLILTIETGQSVLCGEHLEVFVCGMKGDRVKLGFQAPRELKILRRDVIDRGQRLSETHLQSERKCDAA